MGKKSKIRSKGHRIKVKQSITDNSPQKKKLHCIIPIKINIANNLQFIKSKKLEEYSWQTILGKRSPIWLDNLVSPELKISRSENSQFNRSYSKNSKFDKYDIRYSQFEKSKFSNSQFNSLNLIFDDFYKINEKYITQSDGPFGKFDKIPNNLKIEMAKLILDTVKFKKFLNKNTNNLSDHNPISYNETGILIISWNVMNNGLMAGGENELFNKTRANIIIEQLNDIIINTNIRFIVALQECPGYVYEHLKNNFETKYGSGTSGFCFQNIASCIDGINFIISDNNNDILGGFAFFCNYSSIGEIDPAYITDTVCTAPNGSRSLGRSARGAFCRNLGILNVHFQKCEWCEKHPNSHQECINNVCPIKRAEDFFNWNSKIFERDLYIRIDKHLIKKNDSLDHLLAPEKYNEIKIKNFFGNFLSEHIVSDIFKYDDLIVGDFNMSNLENRNPEFSVLISNGLDYITKSLPYVYFYDDDDDNNFDDDDI
jgi:hypothetical protein